MRKLSFLTTLFIIIISCSKSEEMIEPVTADLSVTTSTISITWLNQTDLMQQLQNALTYFYGNARESETEKKLSFAVDSSQVIASINFKSAYHSVYNDPNTINNSTIINLTKEIPIPTGVELNADGPGNTYELITSVLAPGYNPIETPDCSHTAFGNHIDELFDADLNANVFRFFIHTTPDDDRCIVFDRQRNEIKTYGNSPDNLLGIENEKVIYRWKFKLPSGFQSSPKFTHIHQLKSVGGSLASMPMYTLTTRKGTPDQLELRYAETDSQITLKETDLAPFIGTWVEVTETIEYANSGSYEIEIKKVSDNSVLFSHSENSIVNWRPGGSYVRPKWGIYRSLVYASDLRDEEILFADFNIAEID